MDEDSPWTELVESDYYARSKREAEEVMWSVARDTGLSAVALRPCVIYGERDRVFLPRVVRAMRFGIAPLVGRGDNLLTVVYAGNVAEAIVAAVERPDVTGNVNVANDGALTQRQFLETVAAAMGRQLRLVRVPVAAASGFAICYHGLRRLIRPGRYAGMAVGAARFMAADNPFYSGRASTRLGWSPSTPPSDAVRRSVEWFVNEQ
jgi:nucleoside-diphosphate-sugar epimerase